MKRLTLVLFSLACFGIAVPVFWGATEIGIKQTSDYSFCGGCHSMEPMVTSYLSDIHGGNNVAGIRATCSDCHLPHDGPFSYLTQKAKSGAWDVWKEHIAGAGDVNWHAKRERRDEYTYNSGCISCHNALDRAAGGQMATVVAHAPVLNDNGNKNCVGCHQHVGHYQLSDALTQHFGTRKNSE